MTFEEANAECTYKLFSYKIHTAELLFAYIFNTLSYGVPSKWMKSLENINILRAFVFLLYIAMAFNMSFNGT